MFGLRLLLHPKGLKDLHPEELLQVMQAQSGLKIVDVRRPQEYARGHIAGAVPAPLGTTGRRLGDWPRDTPIALICLSGHRSQAAATELLRMGFSDVSHLAGGMLAWHRKGLPMTR